MVGYVRRSTVLEMLAQDKADLTLHINAAQPERIELYGVNGVKVAAVTVPEGHTTIALRERAYIGYPRRVWLYARYRDDGRRYRVDARCGDCRRVRYHRRPSAAHIANHILAPAVIDRDTRKGRQRAVGIKFGQRGRFLHRSDHHERRHNVAGADIDNLEKILNPGALFFGNGHGVGYLGEDAPRERAYIGYPRLPSPGLYLLTGNQGTVAKILAR